MQTPFQEHVRFVHYCNAVPRLCLVNKYSLSSHCAYDSIVYQCFLRDKATVSPDFVFLYFLPKVDGIGIVCLHHFF